MTVPLDPSQIAAIVRSLPIFKGISEGPAIDMIKTATLVDFEAGDVLIRQGDVSDFALILIEGTVDVRVETRHGSVHLASLEAPALAGEIGVFTNVTRTASIQASSRIRAARIDGDELHRFGQANPVFLSALMLQLGRRLETFNKAIGFFSHAFSALERNEFDISLLDDLKHPLPELVDFSRSFFSLAEQITLRQAQRAEMANARAIQTGMLPGPESLEGSAGYVDVHAVMRPARDVGGDLYDFFFIDSNRLAMTIGDVCGKGIPAALFMAVTQMIMRYMLRREPDVGAAATAANSVLAASNPETMFTTLFSAVLDLTSGELTYCTCGHHSPLILRKGGAIEKVPIGTLPLGIDVDTIYTTRSITMMPGDRLFLFTDGFVDAMDSTDARFGDERLEQMVADLRTLPPQDFMSKLIKSVDDFAGSTPQFDDITALLADVVIRKPDLVTPS